MVLKRNLLIVFIFFFSSSPAQKIIFADNFEQKKIDSSWQIVSGNWRIGDVQELRIAPAEKGYSHVLLSGGETDNAIRLFVDIPDSLQSKKIRLSFSYYILSSVTGTKIEAEFYQKEMKDGLRGSPWVYFLYRKPGRWSVYQQTMSVPPRANSLRIVFFALKHSAIKDMKICFDNIVVSAVK